MSDRRIVFRVRTLGEVSSTNDEVKRGLETGEREGLAVVARRQSAGYGRQGRTWASPEGGLYCSLLLRPRVDAEDLPTLSLVASIAVRRALLGLADAGASDKLLIKWPNDLVVPCKAAEGEPVGVPCGPQAPLPAPAGGAAGGSHVPGGAPSDAAGGIRASFRKLCGISLEAHAKGACVGIGVNVLPCDAEGVGEEPAYLRDLAPRLVAGGLEEALRQSFQAILAEFGPLYLEWERGGFAPLSGEYNAQSILGGRTVRVVDREGRALAAGGVQRVDGFGRLVLRDEGGRERALSSGEAHLV